MKPACEHTHGLLLAGTCPWCDCPVVNGLPRPDLPPREAAVRRWNTPALLEALEHPDKDARTMAVSALLLHGPEAGEALPVLRSALGNREESVRWLAAHTLHRMGSQLTRDGAEQFEREAKENPNDGALRLLLLGYDFLRVWMFESARQARQRHVFWVEEDFDPPPLGEVAGLVLAPTGGTLFWDGSTRLVDREGKVVHRLDRQVVAGKAVGKDCVFVTSRDVVRLSPDDKAVWAAPFEEDQWLAGGGLVEAAGGDLVAFLYGRICDSGVEVVRLDPATGKVVWRACCAPLGVDHSAYQHRATVAVEGDTLRVTSKASGGTFVEVLDLASGWQWTRTASKR